MARQSGLELPGLCAARAAVHAVFSHRRMRWLVHLCLGSLLGLLLQGPAQLQSQEVFDMSKLSEVLRVQPSLQLLSATPSPGPLAAWIAAARP